jgi:hypothetical protein
LGSHLPSVLCSHRPDVTSNKTSLQPTQSGESDDKQIVPSSESHLILWCLLGKDFEGKEGPSRPPQNVCVPWSHPVVMILVLCIHTPLLLSSEILPSCVSSPRRHFGPSGRSGCLRRAGEKAAGALGITVKAWGTII